MCKNLQFYVNFHHFLPFSDAKKWLEYTSFDCTNFCMNLPKFYTDSMLPLSLPYTLVGAREYNRDILYVSQHIAAMPEHMQTLRQMKALDKLISLLSEDNEYIVTQVCGILNNLSSSSLENVDSLRSLNNPHFLTLLRKDRNRGVVRGAKLVLERMILIQEICLRKVQSPRSYW